MPFIAASTSVDCIVDDTVQTYIYLFTLRSRLCCRIRTHIESDDDRIGGRCQDDIGLVDRADAAMDNLYDHLFIGQLQKALLYCLHRTLNIGLYDDIQLF